MASFLSSWNPCGSILLTNHIAGPASKLSQFCVDMKVRLFDQCNAWDRCSQASGGVYRKPPSRRTQWCYCFAQSDSERFRVTVGCDSASISVAKYPCYNTQYVSNTNRLCLFIIVLRTATRALELATTFVDSVADVMEQSLEDPDAQKRCCELVKILSYNDGARHLFSCFLAGIAWAHRCPCRCTLCVCSAFYFRNVVALLRSTLTKPGCPASSNRRLSFFGKWQW